jgi:hypothetical protein
MTPLEIFFVISGTIILILWIDIAKKEKFNALHFLVFIVIGVGLLVFSFFPRVLDYIGKIIGIQRWADGLVYMSIIFLLYFSLLLLIKVEWQRQRITALAREIALLQQSIDHDTKK